MVAVIESRAGTPSSVTGQSSVAFREQIAAISDQLLIETHYGAAGDNFGWGEKGLLKRCNRAVHQDRDARKVGRIGPAKYKHVPILP